MNVPKQLKIKRGLAMHRPCLIANQHFTALAVERKPISVEETPVRQLTAPNKVSTVASPDSAVHGTRPFSPKR